MKYITTIGGKEFALEVIDEKHVSVNGKVMQVDFAPVSNQPVYSLLIDGQSHEAYIYEGDENLEVLLHGRLYPALVEDEREKRLKVAAGGGTTRSGEFHLKAPMPGLVVSILVQEGQPTQKGDVLVILESMKMQNELKSPKDGTVQRIRVKAGETVEQKAILLSVI